MDKRIGIDWRSSISNGLRVISAFRRSANVPAASRSVSGRIAQNSSPP
jgi:hypothetical protein